MPGTRSSLRRVWYVAFAHTTIDFYMTLFPPLLALFKSRFGLSLVQMSLLPTVVIVFGSLPQPFMGYLGDRTNRMALAALGVLVCGIFVSFIGFAPSAPILALLLIATSLGSSLFHPTGGGLVTAAAPRRSNLAMAIFLTGGTLGMALAPVIGTHIVERYGLERLWVAVFPAILVSAVLFRLSRNRSAGENAGPSSRISFAFLSKAAVRPLWTLYTISVLRNLVYNAYINFTSVLGEEVRGWEREHVGWVLSTFLVATLLGRICGGCLGDRISPRRLLALSCALSPLFFVGFSFTDGPIALALFFLSGFLFDTGATTNIILAQRVLPRNTSTATGLVMGLAWGTTGPLILLVGVMANAISIPIALSLTAALLFPAAALVRLLPAQQKEPTT